MQQPVWVDIVDRCCFLFLRIASSSALAWTMVIKNILPQILIYIRHPVLAQFQQMRQSLAPTDRTHSRRHMRFSYSPGMHISCMHDQYLQSCMSSPHTRDITCHTITCSPRRRLSQGRSRRKILRTTTGNEYPHSTSRPGFFAALQYPSCLSCDVSSFRVSCFGQSWLDVYPLWPCPA